MSQLDDVIATLIDVDDNSENIYIDSNEHDHSDNPLFKQALREQFQWGVYAFKPVPQHEFDVMVSKAASAASNVDVWPQVAAASGQYDIRPRIFDKNSKKWCLLDSGAAVTVYPSSLCSGILNLTIQRHYRQ